MSCNHPPGEACHCNRTEPCLIGYAVTAGDSTQQYRGGEVIGEPVVVIDEGEGAEVDITLEGSCQDAKPTCPNGYMTDNESFAKDLSVGQNSGITVRSPQTGAFGLWDAFMLMLAEDTQDALPYKTYQICVTQCDGQPQEETHLIYDVPLIGSIAKAVVGVLSNDSLSFKVYPKVVLKSELTLSYKKETEEKSDEERYDERTARYEEYLRNGGAEAHHRTEIPKSEIKEKFSLEGSLSIKEGSTETKFGTGLTYENSNYLHKRDVQDEFENIRDQLKLISSIIDTVGMIKSGMYRDTGEEDIKLVTWEFKPPVLKLGGSQTTTLSDKGQLITMGKTTLGLDPLFDFSITLDVILAAAAYFKIKNLVQKLREEAKKLEDKVKAGQQGAYFGAEFFVMAATSIKTEGSIECVPNKSPTYAFDAEQAVTMTTEIGIRSGVKVWVLEGLFELTGGIVANAKCVLKGGEDKTELIFCHEGIKAYVKMKVTFSGGKDKTTQRNQGGFDGWESENSATTSEEETQEWVWVDPLSADDSPYRTTLFGGD
ncbi:hypothetical protein BZG06_01145 [Salinivibrio kushneri]|uniref:Uncharacterized protein n=1 Tax=Salinivibrio kushneri TaxID=1908198 RepID=A0AB36K9Y0_9GAMM|nr:hypothetical protein [Salinivibrio kushneri]OOE45942.1 hypothetical protein BZG09_02575 [Salinivibrio kushneri]OOE47883.1 hypothetical protein BZG06_01145 [Salinivibrio kushneri]